MQVKMLLFSPIRILGMPDSCPQTLVQNVSESEAHPEHSPAFLTLAACDEMPHLCSLPQDRSVEGVSAEQGWSRCLTRGHISIILGQGSSVGAQSPATAGF